MSDTHLFDAYVRKQTVAATLELDAINKRLDDIASQLAKAHSAFRPETIKRAVAIGYAEVLDGVKDRIEMAAAKKGAVAADDSVLTSGAISVIAKTPALLDAIQTRLGMELRAKAAEREPVLQKAMAAANAAMADGGGSLSAVEVEARLEQHAARSRYPAPKTKGKR